jgi:hypothetical protein
MSCTKVIDLKLGNDTGKLVIEGNITNVNGPQFIKLSRNVPFTSTNTYPPVTGATVTLTDTTGIIYTLTEYPAGTYYINPYRGRANGVYKMTVLADGITYSASSTMPGRVKLDSISTRSSVFNNSNNRKQITVHFLDPAGIKNQYRFVMYVNKKQVKATFALNDDFSDGRYVDFDLFQNNTDIFPGDTVSVEMQCIDKPMYTYWFTLMQQSGNNPGGGVAPSNPPSNITPTCLGYFSAHTTQTQTIIVK